MGVPAVRHAAHDPAPARPRLRVVKSQARAGSRPKNRTSHAAAYQAFVFFAVTLGVVAALGLGRVWMSVQAAQASLDSAKLRTSIKSERYKGDMLEIQQSALATPSRVRAIAAGTMGMAPATSISYLDLGTPGPLVTVRTNAPQSQPVEQVAQTGVLTRVMDVVAGEARVLLVGDVGLASSR